MNAPQLMQPPGRARPMNALQLVRPLDRARMVNNPATVSGRAGGRSGRWGYARICRRADAAEPALLDGTGYVSGAGLRTGARGHDHVGSGVRPRASSVGSSSHSRSLARLNEGPPQ
jgi:hypothetical protein